MREFLISRPSLGAGRHYVDTVRQFPLAITPMDGSSGILDPPLVTRKGAPQKNRLKGSLEKNPKRKRVQKQLK